MKEFTYTVKDKVGIHARPAGMLVKLVKEYSSDVYIEKGDKRIKADRLIAVMNMGIKQGDTVTITIEGVDEEEAYKALYSFFEKNL
jgi:phosphocarrier protein